MFRRMILRRCILAPLRSGTRVVRAMPVGCCLALRRGLSTENTQEPRTVNTEEIKKFSQLSNTWWDEKSNFASLHTMNRLRIPLIKQSLCLSDDVTRPLAGSSIVDVGCGGGILSEPMARLGASVVGLDASEEGITAALQRRDSLREPTLDRNLTYQCTSVEDFVEGRKETFDLVVASEVVEHVSSLDTFIGSCVQLLKPGGSMVVTTINQTQMSYWLTIVAAENFLNLVEKGTHDWNKYVKPQHLQKIFEKYDCQQTVLHGMALNVLTLSWSWTDSTHMNYAAVFVKAKS